MILKMICPDCKHEYTSPSEQSFCIEQEGKCFKCLGYKLTEQTTSLILLKLACRIHPKKVNFRS